MNNQKKRRVQISLFIFAILFISFGVIREEHTMVLKKAVGICLECIGIG